MRKQAKREARRKTGAGGTGASSSTCEVHRLGGASSAQHARSTPALTATAGRRPASALAATPGGGPRGASRPPPGTVPASHVQRRTSGLAVQPPGGAGALQQRPSIA